MGMDGLRMSKACRDGVLSRGSRGSRESPVALRLPNKPARRARRGLDTDQLS